MNANKLQHVFNEDPSIQTWIKEFDEIKKEFLAINPFRRGSILKRWQTCRKAACMCKTDKTFHNWPYQSWTLKQKQKTLSTVIPEEFLSFAKQSIHNAQALDSIIKRLSELSEKIIQKQIQITRQLLKNSKNEVAS